MGSIGYHAAFASSYFLESLRFTGQLGKLFANGGDILYFALPTGEAISAHFIDSALPLYEIRNTLKDNMSKGIATIYLLWADMMLPNDGQRYVIRQADDWMEALYWLYGDTIYGYDVYDGAISLFPVYFRGEGLVRLAEFGPALDFHHLGTRNVKTTLAGLNGTWRVADFGGARGHAHDPARQHAHTEALGEYYALLGIDADASRDAIKRAYRDLARRLHPDTNREADAHDRMQQLNDAYVQIIASLAGE